MLGKTVIDTKYNERVVVTQTILEAFDRLPERWTTIKGEPLGGEKKEVREKVVEKTEGELATPVEAVRAEYLEVKGEEVPVNKKNDIEWMKAKIAETK